jgi:hypothetical protein
MNDLVDIVTILIMIKLITFLIKMTLLITLNVGYISNNDILSNVIS